VTGRVVVLDTNVLVAAIRSRQGASFRVLEQLGTDAYEIVISVPLVLEYEDALLRRRGSLSSAQIGALVDYLCKVGRRQRIFYLWRPLLRDPKDDMVAEVAVAGGAEAVVTHNRKDFVGLEKFGIRAVSPQEFLRIIGGRA
jgi:putative PIN family toxin of toxin-antitoxin system